MPLKLGVLVPSSNTALEPLTAAIVASLGPHVTVHFSRFPVTSITLEPAALAQFDVDGPIMTAARMLMDAKVDVIGWSGTSGGWMGFEVDEKLCRIISDTLGIPATTSVLALNRALALLDARRLGLITPYVVDIQDRIVDVYAAAGFEIIAESHLSISDNTRIADINTAQLDAQVKEVLQKASDGPKLDAITTFCTNLSAARLVAGWEEQHGITVLDTVTTVVWDMLRLVEYNETNITGWGRIFAL